MSFKKKQLIGFGLILLFLAVLLTGIIFMLNSIKSNMTEIVEDRYYKAQSAMEIRQLFSRTDREILFAVNEENKQGITRSLQIVESNNKAINTKIAELSSILNTVKAKQYLKQVETEYASYNVTEAEIVQSLTASKSEAELKVLMEAQGTKRLKVMKSIETFTNYQESLMNAALSDATETYNSLIKFIIIAVCVSIIVIAATIIWMIRSTSNNLQSITQVIKRIDFKDLTNLPRIPVKTEDEIGEIAQSFNEMAGSLETYNQKEKEFTAKISDQNWIQTRLADMATMYQRIVDMEALGNRFITRLTPMMGASLGAFYVKRGQDEEATFVKIASFAGNGEEAGRMVFKPGEGLIGQCILEKRSQVITHVPDDFKLVTTGLGETSPKSIFITPVVFEDEVVAVIELGSLELFSQQQQTLLNRVVETLGITINSVQGRMEIERLLKESQAQTEELQTQSEELQAQSEEMQAQSEELQTQAEELRMINEQLEERNRDTEEKSRELQRVKVSLEAQAEELKLSSKYKSEFLANMSHELRTPLNSILILSEMLSDQSETGLSSEQQEFARVINTSGQDLLSLINDILDLSKVEVGKLDLVFEETNLSELPETLVRNFEHVAAKKGLDFKVKKGKDVPDIFFTDEQRFQQILKNLLSNAIKLTEKGSVSVHIKLAEEEQVAQFIQTRGVSTWVEIKVVDTGIGIPKEKQEQIFESFQQVNGATMRKYGGTGLGLSICREFAKLLGGWVMVDSEEGRGSVFTLFIPSLPEGVDETESTSQMDEVAAGTAMPSAETNVEIQINVSDEKSGLNEETYTTNIFKDKKVLVVDDDHRNIYALKFALEREGMEIISAGNGLECLDILKNGYSVDVILMDIMMPEMDGYETMRRIRSEGIYDEVPIIALTAKAMKGDREKCLKAGASDYVSKPLKMDQLLSVLRVWLTN